MTEATGVPVAVTGATCHDMKKLAELLDAPAIELAPATSPHLVLDRGYDYPSCRDEAAARGYTAFSPPKTSAATPLPAPNEWPSPSLPALAMP